MKNKLRYYNKFVGISEWPPEAQQLTQVFSLIRIIFSFAISLTSTFLILYVLDALGFKLASIVLTVLLAVQLVTDYPTGILSDYIGQRWIFASAIFILSLGMFLLAYATSFIQFIISGAIIELPMVSNLELLKPSMIIIIINSTSLMIQKRKNMVIL